MNDAKTIFFGDCPNNSIKDLKASLLVACSIGRYSLYLWTPTSEGGLGYNGEGPFDDISKAPPRWGVDDIWGAATGAL